MTARPLPVVVLTGIDRTAMESTAVGLAFDLPRTVSVRHEIDAARSLLVRVVSDVTGVVDRAEVDLEHLCVTCAVREDVVPTLLRCADDPRWDRVVAHLPVAAEARQLCDVVAADPEVARRLRIAAVLTAVDGPGVADDVLGDDLLAERGLATAPHDRRGVGEVLAAMVEHADVVTVRGAAEGPAYGLLRALAPPTADVVDADRDLGMQDVLDGDLHDHDATTAWTSPDRRMALPTVDFGGVWRADLRADRPFHPGRLLAQVGALGSGRHRSRGCFWLPTRPGTCQEWAGAGGQLSIGAHGPWRTRRPLTRLVLVGVGEAPPLQDAFERMLLDDAELAARGTVWECEHDGLEPWLGPVTR